MRSLRVRRALRPSALPKRWATPAINLLQSADVGAHVGVDGELSGRASGDVETVRLPAARVTVGVAVARDEISCEKVRGTKPHY